MARRRTTATPGPTTSGQSPLKRELAHYIKVAKTATGGQMHYAAGAAFVLERVVALRDSLREEMKQLWRDRAGHNTANHYYQAKEMVNDLDRLMEG